jgi:glycosyltransferase involved in cell wall biosynthesis
MKVNLQNNTINCNPLISIIVPVFNVEDYITSCLTSILNQDYNNLEVVIINDKTKDRSMEVSNETISKLRKRYNVVIIEHKNNMGLSAARNSGIKNANGAYLFFLDSDDELYPYSISVLVESINKYGDLDIVIGNLVPSNSNNREYINLDNYLSNNHDILCSFFINKWPVMACNKLINSNFIHSHDILFKDKILHEDMLFSFLLAINAKKMAICNQATYKYRIRNNSIKSNITNKNIENLIYIIKTEITLFSHFNMYYNLFYFYIINKCYYICKLIYKNNVDKRDEYIKDLQVIINSIKEYKSFKFSFSFKEFLLLNSSYIISLYFFLLSKLKHW